MDLTQLKPEVLKSLLKLSEQKSALLKEIEALDHRIASLSSGRGQVKATAVTERAPRRGRPRGRPAKSLQVGGRRGALKVQILEVLQGAGAEGISVKEIAERLAVKPQNVHVWFSSTGKKLSGISKVGEARYAVTGPIAYEGASISRDVNSTAHLQPEA